MFDKSLCSENVGGRPKNASAPPPSPPPPPEQKNKTKQKTQSLIFEINRYVSK